MGRIALTLAFSLFAASCAGPTPYAPAGTTDMGGGFTEQRIEEGRYRVSFSGNALTRRDTVETYLLYRAAELTLEQGGDHFVMVERSIDADTTYYADYDPLPPFYRHRSWPYRYYHPHHFGPPYAVSTVRKIDRYKATAEFVIGTGPKPEGESRAYDATEVMENLGPTIRKPDEARR